MYWLDRYLPFVLSVLFVGVLLGGRGLRFGRRFGRSPFCVPSAKVDLAGAILSALSLVTLISILLLAAAHAFYPRLLVPAEAPRQQPAAIALIVGTLLILIGAGLAWRAQEDMQESWRVGIDPTQRTRLVANGLFRFCRNPIYLGLQLAMAGFAMLVPGTLSLLLLATTLIVTYFQARLEEAHLLRQHGAEYAEYCQRVGRFFPHLINRSAQQESPFPTED